MRNNRVIPVPWFVAMLIFVTNCGDQNELQDLDSSVGFRFGMRGDATGINDFVANTRDEEIIALARDQILLPVSERTFHIHGVVASGDGHHNLDWKWHFISSDWVLAESSVEVCDISPSEIETLLENLPHNLKTIPVCPLNSYVKSEIE